MDNTVTETLIQRENGTLNESEYKDLLNGNDADVCENTTPLIHRKVDSNPVCIAEFANTTDDCDVSVPDSTQDDGTETQCERNGIDTQKDEFTPTIVDIRGSLEPSTEVSPDTTVNTSSKELSQISIVDVQGSIAVVTGDVETPAIPNKPTDVETEEDDVLYIRGENDPKLAVPFAADVSVKEEPRYNDDSMLVDADVGTCFTSEIDIEDETAVSGKKEVPEVSYLETTSRVPSPIPIKIEADADKEASKQNSGYSGKEISKTVPVQVYSSGYTCHLCDKTFQEHELLNQHMTLHRKNRLVESKFAQTKNKSRQSKYTCKTCNRRLSTLQSLQQHNMIHNNEKPHVCPICKKDFRHLSNYKMHLQKHEEEDARKKKMAALQAKRESASSSTAAGKGSVARAVDFGRLVGPLFMKQSLLGKRGGNEESPMIIQKYAAKACDSVKENLLYNRVFRGAADGRTKGEDSADDIIPLKTFNNVENIVMNATRLTVKVENLDPNVLKKKIKTPDISIDRTAIDGRTPGKKHRVPLPSTERIKKLKLDQIENIIMDDPPTTGYESSHAAEESLYNARMDDDYDRHDEEAVQVAPSRPKSVTPSKPKPTMTENELFVLLNDSSEITKKASPNVKNHQVKQTSPKSNVIVLKSTSDENILKRTVMPSSSLVEKTLLPLRKPKIQGQHSSFSEFMAERSREKFGSNRLSELKSLTGLLDGIDEAPSEYELDRYDVFDAAFYNVALRRLKLIQKKAEENEGKVENKYLLGPLFWRKALMRAQKNKFVKMGVDQPESAFRRVISGTKFSKVETRRTNDPTKLQQRAEMKMKFMLDRIRMMSDLSNVNLVGPLFWKRTLKLAGVHDAQDLKTFVNEKRLSLDGVRFVESEQLPQSPTKSSAVAAQSNVEENFLVIDVNGEEMSSDRCLPEVPSPLKEENIVDNFLNSPEASRRGVEMDPTDSDRMVDSMLNDEIIKTSKLPQVEEKKETHAITVNDVSSTSNSMIAAGESSCSKADSILYESLTKPRTMRNHESNVTTIELHKNCVAEPAKPTTIDGTSFINTAAAIIENAASEEAKKLEFKLSTRLSERYRDAQKTAEDEIVINAVSSEADVDGGSIILNVDSADFQLIAGADMKMEGADGGNYVLVSDENGGVQLVSEKDLRLVGGGLEENADEPQYVMNVPEENFDLITNSSHQLTYALQFDGENYTAVQFVQDDGELPIVKDTKLEDGQVAKVASLSDGSYVLAEPAADLSHIGKELSDFLNINYSILKSENETQQT